MRLFNLFIFLFVSATSLGAQTVYKTPSGKKYHTSVCRYVKNVSESLTVTQAKKLEMSPCTQCKPGSYASPTRTTVRSSGLGIKSGEAQGTLTVAVQCRGTTKAGNRCKRKTKNKNGYCFQHEK